MLSHPSVRTTIEGHDSIKRRKVGEARGHRKGYWNPVDCDGQGFLRKDLATVCAMTGGVSDCRSGGESIGGTLKRKITPSEFPGFRELGLHSKVGQ